MDGKRSSRRVETTVVLAQFVGLDFNGAVSLQDESSFVRALLQWKIIYAFRYQAKAIARMRTKAGKEGGGGGSEASQAVE